jgi:class 3 adenylate cyclase/mannose-6-phosphate isomerase-like protein (cupin superfamily)
MSFPLRPRKTMMLPSEIHEETAAAMRRLQAKPFATAATVRTFPNVRIETVELNDASVGHCFFQPGWRWSTDVAPVIGTPTCQVHHVGYSVSGTLHVEMDDGQTVDIGPDTVFDVPPGHDKWVVGDEPWISIEWGGSGRAFAAVTDEATSRSLATVVFTDIVDSTATLRRLGDVAWRNLLAEHNRALRTELNVHRGREIATTGDGLLALFDSPTRAVRCAAAMARAARGVALEIRAGVHTGEVESVGDDIRGIAVHTAARVLALGGPGDVIVSSTTADLLEGSGLVLEDAGEHELKGLAGKRHVFRLATRPADDTLAAEAQRTTS